jgi:hypothetical protein
MSMFENNNYDREENYQQYLDWKSRQEELAKELEGYDHELDLLREQEEVEWLAAQRENEAENAYLLGDSGMGPISKWKRMPYVPAEDYDYDYEAEVKELTTGQRVVQEAQAVSREDGWGGEEKTEDVRQLAQVTVNGVYRYELEWLPETEEVRVEVDQYRNGDSLYYWYPDSKTTSSTLAQLIGVREEQIRITGLMFFTGNESLAAFNYETRQFMRSEWKDYAEENVAMQFNVEIIEEENDNTIELPPGKMCENQCYDGACDGTNCEFKPAQPQKRPHGIDGTQCDCTECDPLIPDPPEIYPEERAQLPESEPNSPKQTLMIEEPKPGEPLRIIEQPTSDDKQLELLFAVCIGLVAALIAVIFSTL